MLRAFEFLTSVSTVLFGTYPQFGLLLDLLVADCSMSRRQQRNTDELEGPDLRASAGGDELLCGKPYGTAGMLTEQSTGG